jgi:hypothetical protein
MKSFKPYWFLEDPLDTEYKYYILMSFLVDIKKSFGKAGYFKKIKKLLTIKNDLMSFSKNMELTPRTNESMTAAERDMLYNLLDKHIHNDDEIQNIIKNSITVIDEFIDENHEYFDKYKSLVTVETYCQKYNLWDQGILVIRQKNEKNLKIFSWFFSVVNIGGKENIALLMSEVISPVCKNTIQLKRIKTFLNNNIDNFSESTDCFILADVSERIDIETGTEISKEKSIEIIIDKFKNN